MPQMKPILWTNLMIMFSLNLIFMFNLLFFNKQYKTTTPTHLNNEKKITKMNMKW